MMSMTPSTPGGPRRRTSRERSALSMSGSAPSSSRMRVLSRDRVVARTRASRSRAMLIAAWPSADVPPRMTIVWPDAVSRLCRRNVHAVAYDSGMAARSVHSIEGLERNDVRFGHPHVLGVAAVDRAAHAAHQREDALPTPQLARARVVHLSDALDAGHLGHLSPDPFAEVGFRVIQPEGTHAHDHGPRRRLWDGEPFFAQHLRLPKSGDDDRPHLPHGFAPAVQWL